MLAVVALVTGCSADAGGIVVTEVRLGQPTGPNAALYLTATSDGSPDRLLGAETDLAASAEIHETVTEADGTVTMRAVETVDLGRGDTVELEPGAIHLMLFDVPPLAVGDTVQVTLVWEHAGPILVEAEVVDPSDTMGDDG
jgi:copper(I)-binding protein